MKNELEKDFARAFERLTGAEEKPRVLLAFSGGADSTALLLLLLAYRETRPVDLSAMHVHHGLRGEEADRDERFCARLCAEKGVPYLCTHADVRGYAEKKKIGVEEAARILRYDALEREAAKRNAYILTAHHADDLVETMLFHIARGCGSAGLAGMPEKRGRILRPLLYIPKDRLTDYLARRGQRFVTDSSNSEQRFARNRIRMEVLPALREICPAYAGNAAALAQSVREDDAYLSTFVPCVKIDADALRALPSPLRRRYILRAYKADSGDAPMPEGVHIRAIEELILRGVYGKSVSLPGCVRCIFDRTGLTFLPDKREAQTYELPLCEGENPLPGQKCAVYLMNSRTFAEFWRKNEKIHSLFTKAAINSATMDGELTVRSKRSGDKVHCGGMTHSVSKLIASVCADTEKRKTYPVVCDKKGVLWVPGCAVRDGCSARKDDPEEEKIYILMGVTDNELS